jgi:triosephosphate isomerase (TIM)
MPATFRPLIAGNWKMHGTRANASVLAEIIAGYDSGLKAKADLLLCPPFTLIREFSHQAEHSGIAIGGQDCHTENAGAHTGDISAAMLADSGATYILTGHSERRCDHSEPDAMVRAKTHAVWKAGLCAILCIGESLEERKSGQTLAVLRRQLHASVPEGGKSNNLIIAYEPVWAIGTGLTPEAQDITEAHTFLRTELAALPGTTNPNTIRLIYGGSVKPANAANILSLPHVNGALIGGASLKAEDFLSIARAIRG